MTAKPVSHIAFAGGHLVARGSLLAVALALKLRPARAEPVLVFDAISGRQVDIDLRVDRDDLYAHLAESNFAARVPPAGPPREDASALVARPSIDPVVREVKLLARHWRWLDAQRGSASATLGGLIDRARRTGAQLDRQRQAQDRSNRFMNAIAGDFAGFEEATRALYRGDRAGFVAQMRTWPADVRDTALTFAKDAFGEQ